MIYRFKALMPVRLHSTGWTVPRAPASLIRRRGDTPLDAGQFANWDAERSQHGILNAQGVPFKSNDCRLENGLVPETNLKGRRAHGDVTKDDREHVFPAVVGSQSKEDRTDLHPVALQAAKFPIDKVSSC